MNSTVKHLQRSACLFLAVVMFSVTLGGTAKALSPEQKNLYQKGIFYYEQSVCGEGADSAGSLNSSGNGGDVDKFLKALAFQESGGDPRQPGSAGDARGKYQYIDRTWQDRFPSYEPASKYPQAHLAPEEIQDAVAYIEYAKKFKDLNNDLFKLAISHFYPVANSDPSKLDVVPPSNVITPRQYAEKLIKTIKDGGAWEKIPLKYNEAPEFEKWASKSGITAGDPNAASTEGGAVYMLGDSISVRAKTELEKGMEDKKFKPYINASESRSINNKGDTTGFKTSGIDAVKDDSARIKNSSVIIIELGTNTDNNMKQSITDLIKEIKDINSEAEVYWSEVFATASSVDTDEINKTIRELSDSLEYKVIATADQKIEMSSDKVHQKIPEGNTQFAKVIVDAIGTSRETEDRVGSDQANCQCSVNSSTTANAGGSNNSEIAFNFLRSKGLSSMHAAAMVGNFIHESGGDPIKTDNPNPSSGANGIAHWLGGRLTGLYSFAQSKGKDKDGWKDINIQLEYLWEKDIPAQENGGFPALTELKKTTTLKEGVEKFESIFERSGDTGSYAKRLSDAQRILTKYGSGSPSDADGSTQPSTGTECGEKSADNASAGGGASAFKGSAQEAAKAILSNSGIAIHDDKELIQQAANGGQTPLNPELLKFLAAMGQNHKFGISSLYRGPCSGSNHCKGNAADINPTIDGETISYSGHNPKIQKFIDDAAKLLGSDCENGVPNQTYVSKTTSNGSKCQVFLDIGTGPHVHLSVKE